jgi:small conductance mechanosensitive channel
MEDFNEIIANQIIPYGLSILGALVILIAGWLVAGWLSKRAAKWCEESERMDQTLTPIIAKIVKIIILFATFIAVLSNFGFETTSLIALLGAAGLTIGLAMQGTLSNVASGVMILSFRPFEVGDFVNIGGSTGIVDEIGLFMTKMHTPDNIFMILPNSKIWGSEIMNFSRNDTRRVDMVFGISYTDDIEKAFRIIKEALDADSRVLKDPEPLIAVGELGSSSVDILVRPWTQRTDFWMTKLDLTKDIKQRFDRNDITIPFPQQDVHLFGNNENKPSV